MKLTHNFTSKWVDRINDLEIIISITILMAFGVFSTSIAGTVGEELNLTISLLPALISLIALLYSIFIFRFIVGQSPRITAVVTVALLGINIGAIIATTGGMESAYLPLWVLFTLIIGVFGLLPLGITWAVTVLYFIGNQFGIGAVDDPALWLVNFVQLQIPVIASGLFWHNVDSSPQKGKIDTLSSDLAGEKRKAEIIVNAIADGVVVVSHDVEDDGQITLLNPAALEILGWREEEAMQLDYRSVIKLTDEKNVVVAKTQDPFTAVITTNETITRNDLIVHTKSDKSIDISLVVSPIRNPEGVITATIGVFRDISVERREQKQRAEFISTASHEMRTPVAAIEGYLALAMNEKVAKIDTKARDYLGKAIESTRHLGKLFQDLLTSAKAEDGRLTSHPKVTDIGEMVDKLTEDLRFAAEKKGLLVNKAQVSANNGRDVISPVYYSYADPERMREVITNIFDNAVKYTEEGRITIGCTGTPDRVTVSIADTGAGIPQEDIPHLFQKFYRVDSSATRQIGGTGLGLFITKKIVELYNGRIWVESTVGQGSVFYIALPRLDNERAQEMIRAEANTITPLSGVGGNAA